MARPTKYGPEVADRIVNAVRAGLTDKDAALVGGVTDDTFIAWRKRYPDFSERVARARAERAALWLSRIATLAAEQRDWRAYAELLDRCAPDYRKTTNVDHGGTVTHHHRDVSMFTDDEIAGFAAVAARAKAERAAAERG